MKDDLFNELVESVREGGKILRGKAKPSRKFTIVAPDVKKSAQITNFRKMSLQHSWGSV